MSTLKEIAHRILAAVNDEKVWDMLDSKLALWQHKQDKNLSHHRVSVKTDKKKPRVVCDNTLTHSLMSVGEEDAKKVGFKSVEELKDWMVKHGAKEAAPVKQTKAPKTRPLYD